MRLVAKIGPNSRGQLAAQTSPIIDRFYPVIRDRQTSVIMNTFGWLARSGIGLGDWTGYELLRLDMRAESAVKIWVAVEDDLIEPPVVCEFEVPAGKWATLELDLGKAARERGLDLSKIANFWILGRCARRPKSASIISAWRRPPRRWACQRSVTIGR